MNLFDSSALLAFLNAELGADVVERQLNAGGACSTVNWSETAQEVRARRADWTPARALLLSFGLMLEPVQPVDGERAAELWQRGSGFSLADRLCLATAERLGATVWTADTAWGSGDAVRQIR